MKNMIRGAAVAGAALAVALVSSGGVRAQQYGDAKRNRGCSEETIRGTYGIQISGTRPSPTGPIESVIGVVIRHYNGRGEFTQVDNVKGTLSGITPDRAGSGFYQVNEDCSGVAQAMVGPGIMLEERLVIVRDGDEIRTITSQPQAVNVSGIHQRIRTN